MVYVLGIDGGGTKTTGVISNNRGEKLAVVNVGPTNPNSVRRKDLENALQELFSTLKHQNTDVYSRIKRVFAGISGGDHPQNKQDIEQLIASFVEKGVDVWVDNDAVTALYSGTLGVPGVVQIAGTGSITFGINHRGERGRVGGWNYLLGERGSGYALGSDALREAFAAYDGLKDNTELQTRICEYFQVRSLPDIVHQIYHTKNIKEQIAALSRLVVEAADNGDGAAMNIIQSNGAAIGESIRCLIEKLFKLQEQEEDIPVVLAGGLFNRLDLFRTAIEEKLHKTMNVSPLIKPEVEPVGGAVIAALQKEGVGVESGFSAMFQRS